MVTRKTKFAKILKLGKKYDRRSKREKQGPRNYSPRSPQKAQTVHSRETVRNDSLTLSIFRRESKNGTPEPGLIRDSHGDGIGGKKESLSNFGQDSKNQIPKLGLIRDSFGDGRGGKKYDSKRKLSSMTNEKPTLLVIEPAMSPRIEDEVREESLQEDSRKPVAGKGDGGKGDRGHEILKNAAPKPGTGILGALSKAITESRRSSNSNKSGFDSKSRVSTPGFGRSAMGSGRSLGLGLLDNSMQPVNSLAVTLLNPIGKMSSRLVKAKEKSNTIGKTKHNITVAPMDLSNFLGIGGSPRGITGTNNPMGSARTPNKQSARVIMSPNGTERRVSIGNLSQMSVSVLAPKQKKGQSPQSPSKHRKSGINFKGLVIKTHRTNRDSKKDKDETSAMNLCYFRGHRIESPRLIKLKQQMTRDKNSKIKATLVESQGMSMAVRFLQQFKITPNDGPENKVPAGKRARSKKCLSARHEDICVLGSRDEVSHDVLKYLFRPEDDGPKNHDFFLDGAKEDCQETRNMMMGYKNIILDADRDVRKHMRGYRTVREAGIRKRDI